MAGLTVGQKAVLSGVLGLAVIVLGMAVTALFVPLQTALVAWLGGFAALLLLAFALPVRTATLVATPDPAADYADAVARFEAGSGARVPLNPLCHPGLLEHGARTGKVVVLLHGISSCPRAFVDFAPLLHARGHNVLVLRMPRNGHADRATDALKHLTAEELCRFGDTAVDIAAGLGDEVVVLGISAGGTVAAWIGQNRREVTRVLLVAPMFGLSSFGALVNAALMRLTLLLPNVSIWKDPVLRERFEGMPHVYKRQSSRATGEILRLGYAVRRQAEAARPAAGAAVLVTNANDSAVDNSMARGFAELWERQGMPVTAYEFDRSHRLGHEIIDPLEPGADPALTYPVLLRLIEGDQADPA